MSEKHNIRTPEERYGGEGHAGSDPYAGDRPGRANDTPPDPSVQTPDADLDDLLELPDAAPDQNEHEEKSDGSEVRTGIGKSAGADG